MLKLTLAAIGHLKQGPEKDLFDIYYTRAVSLMRPLGFSGLEIREYAAARKGGEAERADQESQLLLSRLQPHETVIILDEKGQAESSATFAGRLANLRDRGEPAIVFMIGGANGHGRNLRNFAAGGRAHLMSLGPATWPHLLARVMLMEQLYRGFTILANTPYHRQ